SLVAPRVGKGTFAIAARAKSWDEAAEPQCPEWTSGTADPAAPAVPDDPQEENSPPQPAVAQVAWLPCPSSAGRCAVFGKLDCKRSVSRSDFSPRSCATPSRASMPTVVVGAAGSGRVKVVEASGVAGVSVPEECSCGSSLSKEGNRWGSIGSKVSWPN